MKGTYPVRLISMSDAFSLSVRHDLRLFVFRLEECERICSMVETGRLEKAFPPVISRGMRIRIRIVIGEGKYRL